MKDADLPPELRRLREQDHAMLMQKLKQEGLTEEAARKHARSELRERDWMERAELHTPGKPLAENVPDKNVKPGRDRGEGPAGWACPSPRRGGSCTGSTGSAWR